MIFNLSIIIPCQENSEQLIALINAILSGNILPKEIIIIDTSNSGEICNKDINSLIDSRDISLILEKAPNAYPGMARNIGLQIAKNSLVGFLDVKTIPENNWLSSSLELMNMNKSVSGVWGMTEYQVSNKKEWLIRCATFGEKPLKTVPGTIMKIQDINKVGNFLPTTRAGEDTDWMKRLKLQQIKMIDPKSTLLYKGLLNIDFRTLIAKWFRNYTHAAKLPYLYAHKSIYYHGIVLMGLIVAFNWNWVV